MSQLAAALDAPIDALLPEMKTIYQDLHRNPELSMQGFRTAGIAAFRALFGERAYETAPASASEDFSIFGRQWGVPYVFWIVGGTDAQTYLEAKAKKQINAIPANHSPMYAPTLHPPLKTNLQAMLTAASVWLCEDADTA